ncbi:Hypothetical protein NGAL_HAMBI2605_42790 [Neorhizobium galegae bv. orientalis]|nr:Hypothetical protein NGAL_HAMBI2605_42790 [Neorhizobium galegae bv. orientalis]
MGTITARNRKDGSVSYMARLRVMRDGATYHETETFNRRPVAAAWMKKRERELEKPGAIAGAIAVDPTLAKAINRYTEESTPLDLTIGCRRIQIRDGWQRLLLAESHARQLLG